MKHSRKIKALFLISCFTYGIAAMREHLPPYDLYKDAMEALRASREKEQEIRTVMRNGSALRKREQSNIIRNARIWQSETGKMYDGATLICVGYDAAMLVDSQGVAMHRWQLPFSKAWESPPHVPDPNPDVMTRFIDAEVYPNGDLLAIYHADNDTPYGYGMVKMDMYSKPIWRYARNVHHDMYVARSGTIYTLIHSYQKVEQPRVPHFDSPMLADSVAVLSPAGEEQDIIPITEAFYDTPYEAMLFSDLTELDRKKHDYLHANSVMLLEESMADKFPMFKPGWLLVSLRNIHTIAVIDPATRKVVWAMRGIWKMQHDAQFLENGNILLFDNLGYDPGGKKHSRVLEIDPVTQGIIWSYTGSKTESFYTDYHGGQQRLPNGNTLTVETGGGNKIMEVTPSGELVWRYIVKGRGEHEIENPINKAYRISYSFFNKDFCTEVGCPSQQSAFISAPDLAPAAGGEPQP
ncbi:MAG: hypothetical protein EBV03_00105 [Proteobacteria bacterium]|nr:hypothetical protein [Pseudomonadota bacterium]